jgi:hypothetical protein
MAERQADDPTLGRNERAARSMPEETRVMLENLVEMFDEAVGTTPDREAEAEESEPGAKREARL